MTKAKKKNTTQGRAKENTFYDLLQKKEKKIKMKIKNENYTQIVKSKTELLQDHSCYSILE